MLHTSLRQPVLGLLAATALFFAAPVAANEPADAASTSTSTSTSTLSRDDVEDIVRDFITKNPQLILTSVDEYQQRTMQEQQTAAVKTNQDRLFRDERSPFIGNEKGDVVIVEFFDYNCGYCKKVLPDIQALADEDKNLKIVFKDLPILGPSSETAAKWALAAQRQQKYFEFHAAMMNHQGRIDDDVLTKAATTAGVNMDRLKKDIDSTDVLIQLERNRSLAGQMNIAGTPAFVIGEELIPGAVDKATLKAKITELRAKAAAAKKDEKPADKK